MTDKGFVWRLKLALMRAGVHYVKVDLFKREDKFNDTYQLSVMGSFNPLIAKQHQVIVFMIEFHDEIERYLDQMIQLWTRASNLYNSIAEYMRHEFDRDHSIFKKEEELDACIERMFTGVKCLVGDKKWWTDDWTYDLLDDFAKIMTGEEDDG